MVRIALQGRRLIALPSGASLFLDNEPRVVFESVPRGGRGRARVGALIPRAYHDFFETLGNAIFHKNDNLSSSDKSAGLHSAQLVDKMVWTWIPVRRNVSTVSDSEVAAFSKRVLPNYIHAR